MEQVSTFANRLKSELENQDISLTAFAKKISYSKQTISAYIKGVRFPKRPVIDAIARALNVNAAWLLGYDVSRETEQSLTSKHVKYEGTERLTIPDEYKDVYVAFSGGIENLKQEDIDDIIKFIEYKKSKK